MCGIAGFISFNTSTSTYNDKAKFAWQALYLSALRGTDGSGVALVKDAHSTPDVFKKAMASYDFLNLKRFDKYLINCETFKALLLHTRSSTRTAATDSNAHPFQCGGITLIHNGHINNSKMLITGTRSAQVDSEDVCIAFAERGAAEILPKLEGDYCFVWHDAKEGTLNIARNSGRPLFYAAVPAWDGIAFMSEHAMLASVLGRLSIRVSEKGYFYPQEHTIMKIDLTKGSYNETFIPFAPVPTRARGQPAITGPTGGTAGGTTKRAASFKLREIFAARQFITSHRDQGGGAANKQSKLRKAQTRLKNLDIDYMGTYGAELLHWVPYWASKDGDGFLIMKLAGSLRTNCPPVIVHDVSKAAWKEMEAASKVFITPYNTLQIAGDTTVIIADLDMNDENEGDSDTDDEVKELKLLKGPGGAYIDETTWDTLVADGCGNCTGAINKSFAQFVTWQGDPPAPICHECSGLMTKAG